MTIVFLFIGVAVLCALSGDDLQVIINSWLSGKPEAMSRLIVTVPNAPQVPYYYAAVKALNTNEAR